MHQRYVRSRVKDLDLVLKIEKKNSSVLYLDFPNMGSTISPLLYTSTNRSKSVCDPLNRKRPTASTNDDVIISKHRTEKRKGEEREKTFSEKKKFQKKSN